MNLFGYALVRKAEIEDLAKIQQSHDDLCTRYKEKQQQYALKRQEEIATLLHALNDIINMQTPSMGGTPQKMLRRAKSGFKQWQEFRLHGKEGE